MSKIKNLVSGYFKLGFPTPTMVTVNGHKIRRIEFFEKYGRDLVLQDAELTAKFYTKYPDNKDQKDFFKQIIDELEKDSAGKVYAKVKGMELPEVGELPNYMPFINAKTSDRFIVNPYTKEVSEISYSAWLSTQPSGIRGILEEQLKLALCEYDPYNLETLVPKEFENTTILKVNTYLPPKWRVKEPIDTECPPIIKRLLIHLFPDKDDRTYVLDWVYHALVLRNETYLVLNGPKGAGKGIFATLLKALVGHKHFAEAPESMLEFQFNAVLDKKRVLFMDEFEVDKAKHNKLKRFINKFQNIEKKGIDADTSQETFNSFVIANNDENDMYLEHDDRRFSVPMITDKPLTEVMSYDEITEFNKYLEDENSDLIYQFGYFIFNRRNKRYDAFSPYKSKKFYSLVYVSLKLWQKFLVDEIFKCNKDKITITDLVDYADMDDRRITFPSNPTRLSDFLMNYKHNGEINLGKLVRNSKGNYIEINPKLKGEIEEDEQELL